MNDALPSTRAIRVAGLVGGVGVALGAFGAHGLKPYVTPERLEIYRTGVLYHLLHAVALLAIALAGDRMPSGRLASWLFIVGVAIFSGSLYALALSGQRWLGAITPLGGIALIAGWATLFVCNARAR